MILLTPCTPVSLRREEPHTPNAPRKRRRLASPVALLDQATALFGTPQPVVRTLFATPYSSAETCLSPLSELVLPLPAKQCIVKTSSVDAIESVHNSDASCTSVECEEEHTAPAYSAR